MFEPDWDEQPEQGDNGGHEDVVVAKAPMINPYDESEHESHEEIDAMAEDHDRDEALERLHDEEEQEGKTA